jgi:signal peptidase I
MSTPSIANTVSEWRPTPWIAVVLGLVFGPVALLYVQRPWFAVAWFVASYGAALALLAAAFGFDSTLPMELAPWMAWVVSIACAVHAYTIAKSTHSVAERKWYSRWHGLVVVPAVALVLTFLIRAFIFEPFHIPSASMHPTLPEGSYVFVSKTGFGEHSSFGIRLWRGEPTARVDRGDIVAFRLANDPRTTYVKRVIGLPGDRIEYVNHRLTINYQLVPIELGDRDGDYQFAVEHLAEADVTIAFMPERATRDFADVVPPGQYFVLGDSRDNARDSRFIGFVPRDHLVGRVVKILRPGKD